MVSKILFMFCASWKKKDEDKFMYMLEDCTLDLSVKLLVIL